MRPLVKACWLPLLDSRPPTYPRCLSSSFFPPLPSLLFLPFRLSNSNSLLRSFLRLPRKFHVSSRVISLARFLIYYQRYGRPLFVISFQIFFFRESRKKAIENHFKFHLDLSSPPFIVLSFSPSLIFVLPSSSDHRYPSLFLFLPCALQVLRLMKCSANIWHLPVEWLLSGPPIQTSALSCKWNPKYGKRQLIGALEWISESLKEWVVSYIHTRGCIITSCCLQSLRSHAYVFLPLPVLNLVHKLSTWVIRPHISPLPSSVFPLHLLYSNSLSNSLLLPTISSPPLPTSTQALKAHCSCNGKGRCNTTPGQKLLAEQRLPSLFGRPPSPEVAALWLPPWERSLGGARKGET